MRLHLSLVLLLHHFDEGKTSFIFRLAFDHSRCDSVETAELLGGQLKALASHTDNLARVTASEGRIRSNLGSDGRSTRESESSEGSGELRHDPVQTTTIYESLAAELRAKLGKYYYYYFLNIACHIFTIRDSVSVSNGKWNISKNTTFTCVTRKRLYRKTYFINK